ncbi:MAG TPA: MinD/ParA family protein [Aliidongia sp.]|uniref:MinD/ParA family protein n=1 Tax=Aliidongia sp. TaxID=1914230 RepID=UPI002DDD0807|nr:MinD/ParA family protein [Aliidongia sp.]HEV2674053.1 MinD/ParA family protein [Aliidongia sp.]
MIVPLDLRQTAPNSANQRTNLLAVASGKGGVGKTWFSITLSHALTLAGRKALLFDGDLGLANVDVQLGMMPHRDLGTVLAGQTTLAEAATRYPAGGFDIIAGRSGTGSLAQIPPSKLAALRNDLALLSNGYDFVIMDMGAGIERTVRSFATQARACIVVTTDEPTAITDAYAFIKVTAMERPNADLRIVVNMASSIREGERTYGILLKACREFLKIEPELGGIIRRDQHVREAIRKQSSLLTRYPNTEAAQDIQAIAQRLIETF